MAEFPALPLRNSVKNPESFRIHPITQHQYFRTLRDIAPPATFLIKHQPSAILNGVYVACFSTAAVTINIKTSEPWVEVLLIHDVFYFDLHLDVFYFDLHYAKA